MSTLLELLRDGRFHSGQALGEALGVSRSAIWKQLQLLEAEWGWLFIRLGARLSVGLSHYLVELC